MFDIIETDKTKSIKSVNKEGVNMNEDFFKRNEDAILRAEYPLYDAWCREDEE